MKLFEPFFWGVIAALGALVIEIVFYIIASFFIDPTSTMPFSQFFVVPQFIIAAACIEEILKYIMISKRFSVLPPEKSKLANALAIGLGFFLFELALILITRVSPAPQFLIEIAIVHIGTAGLIGTILIVKNIKKIPAFIYALIAAVIFHSAYNLLTLSRNLMENYLIFVILGLLIALNITGSFYTRRLSRKMPV